jgi:hypothetical protein
MLGNGRRPPGLTTAMALCGVLVLAGCNVTGARSVENALDALYPDVDFPFENPPRPEPRPANVPPPPPAPPESETVAEEEQPNLPSEFAELVGSGEPDVVEVLGDPNWFEDVPPARMWQYASANCVLQLYFFMELSTRDFRVLSYEVESGYDGDNADQRCFRELVNNNPGTS